MILTRRSLLQSAAAGGLALAQTRRPNILLVTSDQETSLLPGKPDLPNRRKLEQRGVTFSHAFCNTPQCSPARAALMTGLTPSNARVLTNIDPGSRGLPLSPSLPALGSIFQKAGYSTGYFGKWHLGGRGPEHFGFSKTEIGFPQNSGAQADKPVAAAASDWIQSQKSPWLAWVSLLDPHDVYYPPNGYGPIERRSGITAPFSGVENLEGKPAEQKRYLSFIGQASLGQQSGARPDDWFKYRSYYLSLIENIDRYLGQLVAAAGDPESTIVVYTSDHGDALGEHGLPYKGPLMYEELIRVPLTIAAPRSLSKSPAMKTGVRGDFTTHADILPTLTSLAGIEAPPRLDGLDLSKRPTGRDAVFLEYTSQQQILAPIRTIRTAQWKLNWYDSGGKELYDLNADPHEIRNLAGTAESAAIQKTLETRLDAWRPPVTELDRQSPGQYLKPPLANRAAPAKQ